MKTTPMTPELYDYVIDHSDLPHPVLPELEEETAKLPMSMMQISRDQGALMHMLTKLLNVKHAIEVGCFTGFSAISVASALPQDGKLYSFDISEEYVAIAKKYFEKANLSHLVEVRIGPAADGLAQLTKEKGEGFADIAFIDADKENLGTYFERCLALVKTNGLIIVDNVIWGGSIIDQNPDSTSTKALQQFNKDIMNDKRVERMFLHIADGLFLLRKKS